jgi:hypothetical protein
MPDLADPQVDNRPPGYGCTLSYGMRGPSRVLIWSDDPPEWAPSLYTGYLVPHNVDVWEHPNYRSIWTGFTPTVAIGFQMGTLDAEAGSYLLDLQINSAEGPEVKAWQWFPNNFVWTGGIFSLLSTTEPQTIVYVRAPREWMDVRSFFPDVSIADSF